jgi:hypothetical protein
MGVLDDAIREHLDLKRRRGATDDEIARAEAEALGPARRAPFDDDEDDDGFGPGELLQVDPVQAAPPPDPADLEPPPDAAPPTRVVHDIDEDPLAPPPPVHRDPLDQDTVEHPPPSSQLPFDHDEDGDEGEDADPPGRVSE